MKVPKGRSEFKIKDIANIYVGRDLKEDSYSGTKTDEHIYPVYSNTVENFGLYGYYNFEEYAKNSVTVVGRGAGLGTAFSRNHGFGAIGRLLVLQPKNETDFDTRYLTEYINSMLRLHKEDSGIPQLPGATFGNYKVILPNYSIQKAIADTLATWDHAIEKTEKLIELKEKKLKILITKLLKKAHENHTTEYQTLGSILKYEQPTKYIVSCTDYDKNNGIPVLTANKGFILGYTNETSNIFEKNLPAIIFDDFTTDSKFVDFPFKVKSSAMKILYPASQDYDSLYIFLAMTEIDVLLGGHKRYWLSEYQFYEIPVPNYETQKELSNIYKLQLEEIKALNKLLQNYKSQKQGLMQKLLTGEWKVKI